MKQLSAKSNTCACWLWFDVESRYETTKHMGMMIDFKLWFDVESRYETTGHLPLFTTIGCGLM